MGYWTRLAADIPDSILDHRWAGVLERQVEQSHQDMHAYLTKTEEFNAYIKVKVQDAIEEFEAHRKNGMSVDAASELAMATLLPTTEEDDDDTEDYEIEGGLEEQAAALSDHLDEL